MGRARGCARYDHNWKVILHPPKEWLIIPYDASLMENNIKTHDFSVCYRLRRKFHPGVSRLKRRHFVYSPCGVHVIWRWEFSPSNWALFNFVSGFFFRERVVPPPMVSFACVYNRGVGVESFPVLWRHRSNPNLISGTTRLGNDSH